MLTAVALALIVSPLPVTGADPAASDTRRGDQMIAKYFHAETARLRENCLADIESLDQWQTRREIYRNQLLDMLGLDPLPARTELKTEVTGRTEHEDFFVERLHFQSMPGLYVTANLYVPKNREGPLPAILYVCGHGQTKIDGISYGNKVYYHHHGSWFARHGYVCLTIDTLEAGEIEGNHHGTYRHEMWWWLNRGYTPAGVEAWNSIRALDYLQSRPEVDGEKIGVTGRSGGGAYSLWIAAIDDRIQVAVPVAGITDLQNHVVDGCVEGHCDCMFMLNTFQWDYALVAALVAPRPLLISNSDSDAIFPLDGVVRIHAKVRKIYELYDAEEQLGLQITAGPHVDTQELRTHAFRWLNRHLKNDESLLEKPAVKMFEPKDLKVFQQLPEDESNTAIHETFVSAAKKAVVPSGREQWERMRTDWMESLRTRTFRSWPTEASDTAPQEVFTVNREGIHFEAIDFSSQGVIRLRLYLAHRTGLDRADLVVLNVLDEASWNEFLATMRVGFEDELKDEMLPPPDDEAYLETRKMFESFSWAMAYVAPRGIGPTKWDQNAKKQTQHRRRFYLLGQTLDGMRVWDVCQAARSLRTFPRLAGTPLWMQSNRRMAGVTLYASLFLPDVQRLDLYELAASHRQGPYLLNVRRIMDISQAVAMAAERSRVVIYDGDRMGWKYPNAVIKNLGWDAKQIQIRGLPDGNN